MLRSSITVGAGNSFESNIISLTFEIQNLYSFSWIFAMATIASTNGSSIIQEYFFKALTNYQEKSNICIIINQILCIIGWKNSHVINLQVHWFRISVHSQGHVSIFPVFLTKTSSMGCLTVYIFLWQLQLSYAVIHSHFPSARLAF